MAPPTWRAMRRRSGAGSTCWRWLAQTSPARALARLLEADGVHAQLTRDATVNTTVKLRVIGRQQQLLRIDFENLPAPEALEAKRADFDARLSAAKVVIFSDYGKGGLAHVDRMIRAGALRREDRSGRSRRATTSSATGTPRCSPPICSEFREVAGTLEQRGGPARTRPQQLRQALGVRRVCWSRAARRA